MLVKIFSGEAELEWGEINLKHTQAHANTPNTRKGALTIIKKFTHHRFSNFFF